jgi:hypothetical protein
MKKWFYDKMRQTGGDKPMPAWVLVLFLVLMGLFLWWLSMG